MPQWDGERNGDKTISKYVQLTNPQPLMIDFYPYWINKTNDFGLELLRNRLVEADTSQKDFWYVGQAFGELDAETRTVYVHWRKPTPSELNASVMLALAHGIKGLMFWNYWSYDGEQPNIGKPVFFDAIVDEYNYLTPLGEYLKFSLIPRMKSNLGNTLLNLFYTGNFLQHKFLLPTENPPPPITHDYLTIGLNQSIRDMNWHVGFFQNKDAAIESRYFMLVNLLTNNQKSIQIKVTNPLTSYNNYRFKEVEPENNFDISFANQTIQTFTYPAGEGRLYQVSPVVKYGGYLVSNDTITSNITLTDDMTISDNVSLIVNNSVYTIDDTITIQGTGFISGNGYINLTSNGKIVVDSFSRGLFRSVSGVHPKLVWGLPLEFSSIEKFEIYRKKESTIFQSLGFINGNQFQYVDTTTTIVTGAPVANETYADYYVVAHGLIEEERQQTKTSNTIRYSRVEGSPIEKQHSEGETIKYKYELTNNYPNPFNPTTVIKYELAEKGFTSLKVFNILGKEVVRLVNEEKMPGVYEVEFNANNLPSGIYIYRLTSYNFTATKKFVLMK